MATPSLILVPSKYKIGTLYTEVATTSAGTVLGSLGDFSVTRASVATRVNSQGFIETIPAVTNLVVQSQNWLASGWRSDAAGFTITITGTTGTVDPLGTNTANAISPTSGNTTHLKIGSDASIIFTSGTIYTSSAFFKQGTGNAGRYVQVTFVTALFGQLGYANFDLQLGTVAIVSGTSADTNRAASIENYGNGWYRCRLTSTCSSEGTSNGISIALIETSGATRLPTFTGTTTDVLYGWGAQTEVSSSASPYVATTTAAVTNSIPRIDYYTSSGTVGCPALLVEPSAQNLVPSGLVFNNQTGVLYDTTVSDSPAVSINSARITKNEASGNLRYGNQNCSLSALSSSTTYTISRFFKYNGVDFVTSMEFNTSPQWGGVAWSQLINIASAGVTLGGSTLCTGSVENFGNGWYRVSVRITTGATITGAATVSYLMRLPSTLSTGQGMLTALPQFELGSVATSYIPTTAGSVTRNADVISVTGAVSGCIGQTEGTIYAEVDYRAFTSTTARRIVSLRVDATTLISLEASVATGSIYVNIVSGASSIVANASGLTSGIYKIAVAYNNETNGTVIYVNGTLMDTKTAIIPDVRTATIGLGVRSDLGSTNQFNDRIRAVALYTTRLPNEELELLTYPTYYSNVRDLIWGTFAARTSSFTELQSCLQTRHNQLIIV